jgi:hypothetical protein
MKNLQVFFYERILSEKLYTHYVGISVAQIWIEDEDGGAVIRNVASMVEVCQFAGSNRRLVVVLSSYPQAGLTISGEPVSQVRPILVIDITEILSVRAVGYVCARAGRNQIGYELKLDPVELPRFTIV